MISRSDCEPLPKPTLSPFARGYLSLCRCFTAAVWCVPALRVVQWFIYSFLIRHQVIPNRDGMDKKCVLVLILVLLRVCAIN